MTPRVIREIVNGFWKTVVEDDAGGGGSQPFGQSVCLGLTALPDLHANPTPSFAWDQLMDNSVSFNTIAAIPDGMGLTFAFDGSDPDGLITATEEGAWWFQLAVGLKEDATVGGFIGFSPGDLGDGFFGPGIAGHWVSATFVEIVYGVTLKLPAAYQFGSFVTCQDAPTSNPYVPQFANLSIVRVA